MEFKSKQELEDYLQLHLTELNNDISIIAKELWDWYNEGNNCKCPLCSSTDIFQFRQTHYHCKHCKEKFTD